MIFHKTALIDQNPTLPLLKISHFTQRKAEVFTVVCGTLLQGSVLFSSLELLFPLSSQSSPASLVSCYFLNITGTYSIRIFWLFPLSGKLFPKQTRACSLLSFRSLLKSQLLSQAFPDHLISISSSLPYFTTALHFRFYFRAINFITHIIYFTYLSYFCMTFSRGCKLHDMRAFRLLCSLPVPLKPKNVLGTE